MNLQLFYHFKTILMEYRWLEVVLRRFNSSVSYYTDCTVILIGLPVSHVHVQRPANPHTSHMYHVYGLHTSHHHCSHSLTGEAHIDTIIVNEHAAAALVLVVLAVTRVRSCKMLFDYNGYMSLVRHTIGPTHQWSDTPLVRHTNGPTHHWSDTPSVRHTIGPTHHWSDTPLVRQFMVGL